MLVDVGLQLGGAGDVVLGVLPDAVAVADEVFGERTAGLVGVWRAPPGEAGAQLVEVADDAVGAVELAKDEGQAQDDLAGLDGGVEAFGVAEGGFAVGQQDGAAGVVEAVLLGVLGEAFDDELLAEIGLQSAEHGVHELFGLGVGRWAHG